MHDADPPPEYPPWKFAYLCVADTIAARIAAGNYTVKLPSERELAREFGVSYITMRHSARLLRERGLIISVHGKGTFVAPERQPDDPVLPSCASDVKQAPASAQG